MGTVFQTLGNIEEIRIRVCQPMIILDGQQEYFFSMHGRYLTKDSQEAYTVTLADISDMLVFISRYSLFAFEEEVRNGFITIEGGHRIGLSGQAVFNEGWMQTIRNISYLNIRVCHEKKECARRLIPYLYREPGVKHSGIYNTLLVSPPGRGKTTLLRDLIRLLSDGSREHTGLKVSIVDERSEIAGCYRGIPQNDVGMRTDVLDGCPKSSAPTVVFAQAVSGFFATIGMPETAVSATYTIISLAVSCFCLTSLDTGTRLGRFMFQELFAGTETGKKMKLDNMYVATVITAICGFALCLAGYAKVWPLFGACNQLVAVPAFLAVGTYLKKHNKNNKMLYIPIIFMSAATLVSLFFSFKNNMTALLGGGLDGAAVFTNVLQNVIIVPIVILAVILLIDGGKVLWGKDGK